MAENPGDVSHIPQWASFLFQIAQETVEQDWEKELENVIILGKFEFIPSNSLGSQCYE